MNPQVILTVEDDSSIQEGIGILLRGEGYTVIEASSGEEALSRMKYSQFHHTHYRQDLAT